MSPPEAANPTPQAAPRDVQHTAPVTPMKVTLEDLGPVAAMGLMFLATQLLAVLVAGPFEAAGIKAFEDTESIWNPIYYLLLILGFTGIILLIAKYKIDWLIQAIILFAVGATMVYVFWPLFGLLLIEPMIDAGYAVELARNVNMGISVGLAALLTLLLYKWPEWYIVDAVGVLVSAGATAIFGVSFGVAPALLLLVLLAVYDYISVYRTKHMLSLADSVVGLRLPIMLVVPKHRDYSFLQETAKIRDEEEAGTGKAREAMFMGLGDLVIPSILIVVAYHHIGVPEAAIGSLIGTFVGFAVLMSFVLRGKAHAGLPSLNGGSIIGFFLGFLVSGEPFSVLGFDNIF